MFVTLILVTVVTLLFLLLRFFRHKEIDLSHIPGPSFNPWLQLFRKQDPDRTHIMLRELARQYGPVTKIPDLGTDLLVVSGFDEIYQVTIKEGVNFGGRPTCFRYKALFRETGIFHLAPNKKWKTLRKLTQQHLHQFSDGLLRIEHIVKEIAHDMLTEFEKNTDNPYDPYDIVFETAFVNIASLVVGRKPTTSDPVLMKMKEYSNIILQVASVKPGLNFLIMDMLPWLQYLKWPAMKVFERFNKLEMEIWKDAKDYAKEHPEAPCICSVFVGHSGIEELDAIKSTMFLLVAGVITTSFVFYGMINMLAHNKEVQNNIFEEIQMVQRDTNHDVSLQNRPRMSYTNAVLLETLRLGSVSPVAAVHKSLKDMCLNGYKIPANTTIIPSLWTLHHDEDFWEEPYSFKPDRFLDAQGELVPADHPNRKHLMPFGAGTRVCVGESLAMARLFLWMVNLVQHFEISPAPGNNKISTDPRGFIFRQALQPIRYDVIFTKRY